MSRLGNVAISASSKPEWNDSRTDLTALRLTPEKRMERRMQSISQHNSDVLGQLQKKLGVPVKDMHISGGKVAILTPEVPTDSQLDPPNTGRTREYESQLQSSSRQLPHSPYSPPKYSDVFSLRRKIEQERAAFGESGADASAHDDSDPRAVSPRSAGLGLGAGRYSMYAQSMPRSRCGPRPLDLARHTSDPQCRGYGLGGAERTSGGGSTGQDRGHPSPVPFSLEERIERWDREGRAASAPTAVLDVPAHLQVALARLQGKGSCLPVARRLSSHLDEVASTYSPGASDLSLSLLHEEEGGSGCSLPVEPVLHLMGWGQGGGGESKGKAVPSTLTLNTCSTGFHVARREEQTRDAKEDVEREDCSSVASDDTDVLLGGLETYVAHSKGKRKDGRIGLVQGGELPTAPAPSPALASLITLPNACMRISLDMERDTGAGAGAGGRRAAPPPAPSHEQYRLDRLEIARQGEADRAREGQPSHPPPPLWASRGGAGLWQDTPLRRSAGVDEIPRAQVWVHHAEEGGEGEGEGDTVYAYVPAPAVAAALSRARAVLQAVRAPTLPPHTPVTPTHTHTGMGMLATPGPSRLTWKSGALAQAGAGTPVPGYSPMPASVAMSLASILSPTAQGGAWVGNGQALEVDPSPYRDEGEGGAVSPKDNGSGHGYWGAGGEVESPIQARNLARQFAHAALHSPSPSNGLLHSKGRQLQEGEGEEEEEHTPPPRAFSLFTPQM